MHLPHFFYWTPPLYRPTRPVRRWTGLPGRSHMFVCQQMSASGQCWYITSGVARNVINCKSTYPLPNSPWAPFVYATVYPNTAASAAAVDDDDVDYGDDNGDRRSYNASHTNNITHLLTQFHPSCTKLH